MSLLSEDKSVSTPRPDSRHDLTDGELLSRFASHKDQEAFAELVQRHGGLVFATALRSVRDRHAAEDVFQATFLVLARDAEKLRQQGAVAAWLHGVALRCSKKWMRRRERVGTGEFDMASGEKNPFDALIDTFQQQVLDEELNRLPEFYREPLILHFLEDQSYAEIARTLKVSVTAIEGRMKRGKRELQLRLARRGVSLGIALQAMAWSQSTAQAAVSAQLVQVTAAGGLAILENVPFQAGYSLEAVHLADKTPFTAGLPSQAASLLTKETVMFAISKTAFLTTGLIVAATVGWVGSQGSGAAPATLNAAASNVISGQSMGQEADVTLLAAAEAEKPAGVVTPAAQDDELKRLREERKNLQNQLDRTEEKVRSLTKMLETLGKSDVAAATTTGTFGSSTGSASDNTNTNGILSDTVTRTKEDQAGFNREAWRVTVIDPRRPVLVTTGYSPGEQKIAETLNKMTSFEFTGNPLSDVATFLSNQHAFPIVLDRPALSEESLTGDEEVRLVLSGVSLRSALDMLLENVQGVPLTYVVQDDVMKITTKAKADIYLETRIYDVKVFGAANAQQLIELIPGAVEGPWKTKKKDGEGTIAYFDDSLIIRTTQRSHLDVEKLLNNLALQRPERFAPAADRKDTPTYKSN